MELIFKKYFKAIFIKTIKVRRIKHCSYYSQVWKTTQKLKQQTQARNALLLFLPIQVSKSHKWFSEVEGIECSVITLLGGTSSLWWLVLWVVSSHQEICDGCSLLPFRSKLDLKTRQLCPSWNPKSVLLDLGVFLFCWGKYAKYYYFKNLIYSFLETWNDSEAGKVGSNDPSTASSVPIPFQL